MIFFLVITNQLFGQNNARNDNNSIETGFVFIDGKYIDPPYIVESVDSIIYINKIAIKKMGKSKYPTKNIYNKKPKVPDDLYKSSTINELFRVYDTQNDRYFFGNVEGYFYSHYHYEKAKLKLVQYISKLPNVKQCYFDKSTLVIESYSGDKQELLNVGTWEQYNKMFGPGGTGPPSKKEFIAEFNKKLLKYKERLSNGATFFFANIKDERYIHFSIVKKVLTDFIEIANSTLSLDEKVTESEKRNIFYHDEVGMSKLIFQNIFITDRLKNRVDQLKGLINENK